MEKEKRVVGGIKKTTSPGLKNKYGRREFKALEDTRDLSFLGSIAAEGTRNAYLKAVEASDAIVELDNGQVIRRQKDGSVEVIAKLDPRREVQKGKTITLL